MKAEEEGVYLKLLAQLRRGGTGDSNMNQNLGLKKVLSDIPGSYPSSLHKDIIIAPHLLLTQVPTQNYSRAFQS